MATKTIVVDDHAIVRRGIVQILHEHPGISVVAEAGDYAQLRAALKEHGDTELLVMDVGLPGRNGIDILKLLREELPRLRVLIVSMYPEDQYAVRAFRAGAAFDPEQHQAMSLVDAPGQAPGSVVTVFQKGWRLHERLLRPAMVAVARDPQ